MGTNLYNFDITAANNTSLATIGVQGSDPVSNFDNAMRALMARIKAWLLDMGGANTVGGSADALTITTADANNISALYDGLRVRGRIGTDNATTTPTLAAGGTAATLIKKTVLGVETALAAGDMQAGTLFDFTYRSAYNSAAGAWDAVPVEFGSALVTPITHENGGLEADVSAYSGLLKISGGATSQAAEGTDYYGPAGTDIPVTDGGTGSSTASGARTNLGLAIGSDVQGYHANLAALNTTASQAQMEAGTSTTVLAMTPQRVAQAIAALGGSGGLVFLGSTDFASDATWDFTAFAAGTYDAFIIGLGNVIPASNATLLARTSTDGGSSWDAGASDYFWDLVIGASETYVFGDTDINLTHPTYPAISTGCGISGEIMILHPHLTQESMIFFNLTYEYSGGLAMIRGGGWRASAADVDGFRLLFDTGNIASGSATIWGLVNA